MTRRLRIPLQPNCSVPRTVSEPDMRAPPTRLAPTKAKLSPAFTEPCTRSAFLGLGCTPETSRAWARAVGNAAEIDQRTCQVPYRVAAVTLLRAAIAL